MVIESTLRVTVPAKQAQQLSMCELEKTVKAVKGQDWHVDWARFLAVGYKAEMLEGVPAEAAVTLPVYQYTDEGVSHE